MENLKQHLLNGKSFDLENDNNFGTIWFSRKTGKFVLDFNCEIIKATKSIKPVLDKLNELELNIIEE